MFDFRLSPSSTRFSFVLPVLVLFAVVEDGIDVCTRLEVDFLANNEVLAVVNSASFNWSCVVFDIVLYIVCICVCVWMMYVMLMYVAGWLEWRKNKWKYSLNEQICRFILMQMQTKTTQKSKQIHTKQTQQQHITINTNKVECGVFICIRYVCVTIWLQLRLNEISN